MTARPEAEWTGVDIGKTHHHAAAIDNIGRQLWSIRVHNDQHNIECPLAKACATGDSPEIRWAVDLTSPESALLLAVLVAAGQTVTYVPGRVVNRMTGAFPGEGKTDTKDAVVIAETARLRRDLTTITAPDDVVAELSLLTAYGADLMGEWVSRINRLRALLLRIFPDLKRAFDYTTRTGLALLTRYCTPAAIRAAGTDELSVHLRQLGVRRPTIPDMVTKALAAAQEQTVAVQAESTTEQLVTRLARQLLDLDHEIEALDKQITERFRSHHQAHIIESVPGIGARLRAEFLAITAGDLAAFGTAAKLAAYAGLAPRTQRLRHPLRNLEPPQALPPSTTTRLLHGRVQQHSTRRPVARVLPTQARRTSTARPSHHRPRPQTRRRPLGLAPRRPRMAASPVSTPLAAA